MNSQVISRVDLMGNEVHSFLRHLAMERDAPQNTIDAYRNDLHQFQGFVVDSLDPGRAGLTEGIWRLVDLSLFDAYIIELRDRRQYRVSTIVRKVAAVKSFFAYLNASGLTTEDLTGHLALPRPAPSSALRPISEADVERMLSVAASVQTPEGVRNHSALALLHATGMRVSELISLNVPDVNFGDGSIHIRGRGSRDRNVYPYPEALSHLRKYINGARMLLLGTNRDGNAVYVSRQTQPGRRLSRQGIWIAFRAIARDAGIDGEVTPRTLRHGFAAHALQNGTSLQHVREILGHSKLYSTNMYSGVRLDQ